MFDNMSLPVIILVLAAMVIISMFVMAVLWSWVIPDIFSGMVEAELLPASLTLWQAFKMTCFLLVFNSIGTGAKK